MVRERAVAGNASVALGSLLFLPVEAHAQKDSGIAGAVKDAAAMLVGVVTVETSTPALIERTRVVITHDQGLHHITGLPPGMHSMPFKALGFIALKNDGNRFGGSIHGGDTRG